MAARGRQGAIARAIPIIPSLNGDKLEDTIQWILTITPEILKLNRHTVDLQDEAEVVIETSTDLTTASASRTQTIICNNTSAITITLQPLRSGDRVTVVRAGTGAVTLDGNGTNIIGASTQIMPTQYDAAHLIASTIEWLLT